MINDPLPCRHLGDPDTGRCGWCGVQMSAPTRIPLTSPSASYARWAEWTCIFLTSVRPTLGRVREARSRLEGCVRFMEARGVPEECARAHVALRRAVCLLTTLAKRWDLENAADRAKAVTWTVDTLRQARTTLRRRAAGAE